MDLPDECWLIVFAQLSSVRELCSCMQVCRRWYQVANDSHLWRKLCKTAHLFEMVTDEESRSAMLGNKFTDLCWKQLYARHYGADLRWRNPKVQPITRKLEHSCFVMQVNAHWIITGLSNGSIEILSLATVERCVTYTGHFGSISSFHVDTVAQQLITASYDGTVRVTDLRSNCCLMTMSEPFLSGVTSMCAYYGGSQNLNPAFVSCHLNSRIIVWDRATGTTRQLIERAHEGHVCCLQGDSYRVVSGGADGLVRVWNWTKDGLLERSATLCGHRALVMCMQLQGNLLITGSYDFSLRCWDLSTGACIRELQGHSNKIYGLQFDHWRLVSCSEDNTVRVWDWHTGECLMSFKHYQAVDCVAFNEHFILASSKDRDLVRWQFK